MISIMWYNIERIKSMEEKTEQVKDWQKHYNDMSPSRLRDELANLRAKSKELQDKVNYHNSMQLALKLTLNGTYGAFANKWFAMFNRNVAASITAMGREVTQYMVERVEHFFYVMWHKDAELHKKMGLGEVEPIPTDYIDNRTKKVLTEFEYQNLSKKEKQEEWNKTLRYQRKHPVCVYGDTDSIFVGFDPAIASCNWTKSPKEFVLEITEHRLAKWFDKELKEWTESYKAKKNLHKFDLERVNESGIWLGKKRYIQNAVWEDGKDYDSLEYIFPKGVELIKSSTPMFARKRLMEVVKYILSNPGDFAEGNNMKGQKKVHKMLKELKESFKYADIEDISMTTSCSNYADRVYDDQRELRFAERTHFAVKAAAHHNWLLHQNPELKKKYELIKSERIRYYLCTNRDPDKKYFAYLRGAYPAEIAPPVDYDAQFEKAILSVLNSIVEAVGIKTFDKKLSFRLSLFSFDDEN